MPDFDQTSLQAWNRTGFDEFRVVASQSKARKHPRSDKFCYNLKAFFSMEPGMAEGSEEREHSFGPTLQERY